MEKPETKANEEWTSQRHWQHWVHKTQDKGQSKPKGQSKMDNPGELAKQGTQDKEKQNKNIINMYWTRVITKLPNSEQS